MSQTTLRIREEDAATLVGMLSARARTTPDRIAFRFLKDGEDDALCITYAELEQRARALASALSDVAPGSRALLLYAPGLDYIVGVFACAYAGIVAVPAYPPRFNRPMERLQALIADAQAALALTTQDIRSRMARHLEREPALAALRWVAADAVRPPEGEAALPVVTPETLALLQYTSGSTSLPRGVMLTHRDLLANAKGIVEVMGMTGEDRVITWLPPYHDMGLIGTLLTPVLAGAEVTVLAPTSFVQRPLRWLRAISRHRGTISGGPDSAYEHCIRRIPPEQRATLDLSTWRVAFSGAEKVRAETFERFAEAFASSGFRPQAFRPCYGLAEATLAVCSARSGTEYQVARASDRALGEGRFSPATNEDDARLLVSSGPPLSGFEVRTVDPETRTETVPGTMGEVWVRGPSVSQGYWQKPERNAEVFGARLSGGEGPFLRTGDLGFLKDGELFVTGRLKDLIILLGRNHYPDDLERTVQSTNAAMRHAAGAAFSVDVEGAEQLVIAQEVDLPAGEDPAKLVALVRDAVADAHEVPVHDVVLLAPGGVPRTSSGKIQRSLCRKLYLEGKLPRLTGASRSRRASRSEAEPPAELVERITQLMAELLGVNRVRADDDFFALGGHSLVATQLASRLRDAVGVELPVRALFENPTPLALARQVVAASARAPTPPIVPVPRDRPLALSFSQERMWYLYQLEPSSTAYNVCGALQLDGELDAQLLAQAFADVVRRHEVLRTAYPSVEGEPRCVVIAGMEARLELRDLSTSGDPNAQALRLAEEMASTPFDLARGPLFRAALYRLSPSRHVFSLSVHHIVIDGWSMGVLLSELSGTYARMRRGELAPLPPHALQYADYAQWQRALFSTDHLAAQLAYWTEKLKNPPLLELPIDHPRPAGASWRGGLEPLELPAELLDGVRELAVRHGVTPFMVMLAAFEVLLYRYTGQMDLAVGVPIANRNWQTSEQFLGTLVNTLVLRNPVVPEQSFLALLQRVRETALDAYAHQDLPFERLVTLSGERQRGRSPLFQVMFDYQNSPMRSDGLGTLSLKPLPVHRGAAQFELSLFILDTELGRSASVEYSADLFEPSTIRRMLHHYRSLLEAVVADPQLAVSKLPLLDGAERAALTAERARVERSYAREALVPARVAAQALSTPDAVAVVDAKGSITYRELVSRSRLLALQLREWGARPGERVAVALERSAELVVALLGVLGTGAAYVPLDSRHPADRLKLVLEDAKPKVLLTQASLVSQLPSMEGLRTVLLDGIGTSLRPAQSEPGPAVQGELAGQGELVEPAQSAPAPAVQGEPPPLPDGATGEDVAYVLFTSGSTGRPKGVEVPHRALSNFLSSMAWAPGLSADDTLLAITTVSFDIAGLELFLPLVLGATVEVVPSDIVGDALRLRERLEQSGATVMQATPATWRMLIEAGWKGDGKLKILCGGEAMPRELADALLARGSSVWNLYGPTETTIWSTVERVRPGDRPVPIGAPVDNTRLYVLDANLEPVPPGVTGELYIGGHGVAHGYIGRPELTAERFLKDPFSTEPGARMYRTGDAARWRGGELEFLGRLDHQVKVRGFRIELGEIEAALKQNPAVRDAVVLAREERPGDVRLVAYYLVHKPVSAESLRETAKGKLPDYMVPTAWVELAEWPLTPNGKVDRKALPAPVASASPARAAHVSPLEPLEREVAALFEEVLGIRRVGLHDSFFELGGHSLLAVKLFSQLERRTGIALPLSTLFAGPSVAELAESAQRAREQGGAPKPSHRVRIQRGGGLPPFFCVHGAGGNVLNMNELARALGPEQPFYGLQAQGVDGREPPLERVEEMAARYLEEVRALQPKGPYYLGGYCGGGLIAYEMAQQLARQGEKTAVLALLDTYHPGLKLSVPTLAERAERISLEGPAYLWRRGRDRLARELRNRSRTLRVQLHQKRGEAVPYELRDLQLTYAFLEAAAHYRPVPFAGTLSLFHARDGNFSFEGAGEELGWTGFATQGIHVQEVPGTHETMMISPNVQELAEALRERLVDARARHETSDEKSAVAG